MFSVNFNNKNSFDDLDLIIESRPIIPIPERDRIQVIIPGRNGSLTYDNKCYKDVEIPINFALVDNNNIYERSRIVNNWLNGNIIDNYLILSDDPDYSYKVKNIKASNIERFMIIVGKFTATFVCEPFRYLISNKSSLGITRAGLSVVRNEISLNPLETYNFVSGAIFNINELVEIDIGVNNLFYIADLQLVTPNPCVIYNIGTLESKPKIILSGTGDITLTINGRSFSVIGLDGSITIDSEIEDAYNDVELLNNKMVGNFPYFDVGENLISYSGNLTSIELIPNMPFI